MVVKTGSFASCHRISNHKGKCHNLHGHNYHFELGISYDVYDAEFNECNYVIDFGDIKKYYLGAIDKVFDHSVIVNKDDVNLLNIAKLLNDMERIIPTVGDPSIEVISMLILYMCAKVSDKYKLKTFVNYIKIYETESSWCELTVEKKDIERIKVSDYFKTIVEHIDMV